jgi:hypothetical protein
MEREYYFRTVRARTKGATKCDGALEFNSGINVCEVLSSRF